MKGLRLTDLYASIQGEGPRVGDPTVFVRFGGCNMRCPGWPCDTQYAINPSMWRQDPILTPTEIRERMGLMAQTDNICITGGEPTMQPEELLTEFAGSLLADGHTIDVFSNGSYMLFPRWMRSPAVSVILDWKLEGSGESHRGIMTRGLNVEQSLDKKDWVKFVVTGKEDFAEAVEVWKHFKDISSVNWCVGVAWGKDTAQLVDAVLENGLPWRVNVQVHKYIWPAEERQI